METLVKEGALGSVLVRSRIITEEDIKTALDEQTRSGCRFGEALVKLGIVVQEDIDWALSNQLDIPYVRLKPEMIDKEAVALVPESVARKFNLIPIFRVEDEIGIAMADPLNKTAVEMVGQLTGCRVTVSIPIFRELREMLDLFYGPRRSESSFGFSSRFFPPEVTDRINGDTGGARFLDLMLLYIVKNKLTSVSLQPLGDFVAVIGRQGKLTREIGRLAIDYYPDLLMHIRKQGKIQADTDVSAAGFCEFPYKGGTVLFRFLSLKGHGGDYVTFKIHVPLVLPFSYDELDASGEAVSAFRRMLSGGRGVVLFSAPTIEECSHVIGLFLDEYDTAGQTVIVLGNDNSKCNKRYPNIYFGKGKAVEMEDVLDAVLEHDPDILVFEDANHDQTLAAAALAAMRGKISLCGISCRDVTEIPARLMELRNKSSILPQVRGAVLFRAGLVPCPECMRGEHGGVEAAEGENSRDIPAWRPEGGCRNCGYSGFSGRKFMVDAIPFTEETVKAISSARDADEVIACLEGKEYGGKWKEWNELLRAGEIVPAEQVYPG